MDDDIYPDRSWPRTIVVFVAVFVGAWAGTYHLGMWLSPPRTESGHPTMAIGHTMIATVVAIVASLIGAYIFGRRRPWSS